MKTKIAACVIVYEPQQSVELNIKSYINNVEKLYLIDNTKIKTYITQYFLSNPKITSIHDYKNEGIAIRLNQACALAIKDGFDFLLTMDQDSFFDASAINIYLKCIEDFDNKESVAMFGINYQYLVEKENCDYKEVSFLITSGSIINLNSFKNIGAFDENLFIDFVDTEYCFRSIQNNFKIIEFSNIYMHHNLGELYEKYSIKKFKKTIRSFHSPVRLYYMTRNLLYLSRKYKPQFKEELSVHKKDLRNRIKNKLLYQNNRYKTLGYLFKAFKDYRNNKMGRQF
jgi:rhamnosyltransferase